MSEEFHKIFRDYKEISVRYDQEQEAIWCYFNPPERACFSPGLLRESKKLQQSIAHYFKSCPKRDTYPVHYMILASQKPGVFNFGGDLNLFVRLIAEQNRDQLLAYATSCIDICYMNAVNLHLPLTTISLVEGSALGGGFESALSSNVLIAEKQAEMGVPEIRFNLFPGMGAYSFLARRSSENIAERLLSSGKIYTAADLHEMHIVDILAETGQGKQVLDDYIKKHRRVSNGMRAIQSVKQFYNPVSYQELIGITKIWVDAALRLDDKDLRTMEKIVSAQSRMNIKPDPAKKNIYILRTKQDRRFNASAAIFPLTDSSGKQIFQDRRKLDRREASYKRLPN